MLNLLTAAQLLANLTNKPHIKNDVTGIIRAGASGHLRIYWFNDLQTSTRISNFKGDLPYTEFSGPLLLDMQQLRELAASPPILAISFPLVERDFALLDQMQGKYVDDDGNLLVYRHPATSDETVTVNRDHLFVYERDLIAYAPRVSPVKESAEVPVATTTDGASALRTKPTGTETPAQRRTRKPSIEAVALEFMRKEYKANQGSSATNFHKHLCRTAGVNGSPFEMGHGKNARKLFCPLASSFFAVETLGNLMPKIRP